VPQYLPRGEPFFDAGNRVGCLLIHGFTGTPFEMRSFGAFLHARGYTISAPVLAGHATLVAEMNRTQWVDWYHSVTDAYDQLIVQCTPIFAIGLSLGAALALHLAAHRPLAGVVAMAPPIEIKHPLVPFFKTFPVLPRVIPYIKKNPKEDDTQDPEVRAAPVGYDANPTRAARSLIQDFLPHLREDLRDIRAPALLIGARGDRTVPAPNLDYIFAHIASADKELIWLERGGHVITRDYGKDQAMNLTAAFIEKHLHADQTLRQAQGGPLSVGDFA
jgi:carboxylesterase